MLKCTLCYRLLDVFLGPCRLMGCAANKVMVCSTLLKITLHLQSLGGHACPHGPDSP